MKRKMLYLLLTARFSAVVASQILPWIKSAELSRGLPNSIEIFTLNVTNSSFGNLTGSMVKINMKDSNLRFRVVHTDKGQKPKTPMEFANSSFNHVYAAINGGYFDMVQNVSYSFIAEAGKVLYPNKFNNVKGAYPTIGAFGLVNQILQIEYVYCYADPSKGIQAYKFPVPNPFPGPKPTKQSGFKWQPLQAIGGGPILIKNGIAVKRNLQNFNHYIWDMQHPRSVIGIDRQERLLLVAIDGRYQGSNGLTILKLAEVMKELECQNSMNLDGGGSTVLYANKKIINRPSDASGPRPVVSAVLIEDRYKKKQQTIPQTKLFLESL